MALIQEQASRLHEQRKGAHRDEETFQLIEYQESDVVLIASPDRLVPCGFGSLEEAFRWKQGRLEVVEPPKGHMQRTTSNRRASDRCAQHGHRVFRQRGWKSREKNSVVRVEGAQATV